MLRGEFEAKKTSAVCAFILATILDDFALAKVPAPAAYRVGKGTMKGKISAVWEVRIVSCFDTSSSQASSDGLFQNAWRDQLQQLALRLFVKTPIPAMRAGCTSCSKYYSNSASWHSVGSTPQTVSTLLGRFRPPPAQRQTRGCSVTLTRRRSSPALAKSRRLTVLRFPTSPRCDR